jgi:uncharacterized RDD family membrane protein YckC
MRSPDAAWPVAVVVDRLGPTVLRVLDLSPHEQPGDDRVETYELPGDNEAAVLSVDQQLVLAERATDATDRNATAIRLELQLLRQGRLLPAGTLEALRPSDGHAQPLALGRRVGLLTWPSDVFAQVQDDAPTQASVSLTALPIAGEAQPVQIDLPVRREAPRRQSANDLVYLAALVAAAVLIFLFWRRDPRAREPKPTGELRPAPLMLRAMAGFMDTLPGFAAVWGLYGLSPGQVWVLWPGFGQPAGIEALWPPLIVIAVTVVHTAVGETFTGRSIGKAMFGLRVINLVGQTPRPWQTLLRCMLKCIDMIAWLLLVLMLLSPWQQRLCDYVAGTLVVQRSTPEEQGDRE